MAAGGSALSLLNKAGITLFGTSPVADTHFEVLGEVVKDVASGDAHCVILCQSGRVFAFGNNSYNQCGLEIHTHTRTVLRPTLLESISRYNMIQISCGLHSTFFLTIDGRLYVCGANGNGQLGLGHKKKCSLPQVVSHSKPIKSVSSCYEHFMVLTEDNMIYVCGSNNNGQLGLGHRNNVLQLTLVTLPEKCVVKTSCGTFWNVVLSVTGIVYATGDVASEYPDHKKDNFNVVALPLAALDVACNGLHAVLLMTDGSVWCFGRNHYGELGIGSKDKDSHLPVRCLAPDRLDVDSVFARSNCSGLVTKGGEVWLWGYSLEGKLGVSRHALLEPTAVSKSSDLVVRRVAFGELYALVLCATVPKLKPAWKTSFLSPNLSEVEKANVISSLECLVCTETMSPPIHMCATGHSLCEPCMRKEPTCPQCGSPFQGTRNLALENVMASLRLQCPQCLKSVALSCSESHALVCPNRQRPCLVDEDCPWRGSTADILDHAAAAHPGLVWHGSPQLFKYTCNGGGLVPRIWSVDEGVFVVYLKPEAYSRSFQVAVKQLGVLNESAVKHQLKIKFFDLDRKFHCKMSDIAVDRDDIDDVFTTSVLINVHSYNSSCQVALVKQEKYKTLFNQLEGLSSFGPFQITTRKRRHQD